jgi:hypothetical protein
VDTDYLSSREAQTTRGRERERERKPEKTLISVAVPDCVSPHDFRRAHTCGSKGRRSSVASA